MMVITPPHMHWHVLVLLRAGKKSSITVADPGDQGDVTTGTQGAGVGVPAAAEVAAATEGLVCVIHMPTDGMFAIGTKSMMFAASW